MTSKRNLSSSQQSGLMMILSPAKTLNLDPAFETAESVIIGTTDPSCDVVKTNELAGILKKKNVKELKNLLKISDNLVSSVLMVRFLLQHYFHR